jgi:hypothetical protein
MLELCVISSLRYPHPAFAARRLNLPPSTDTEAIERAFSHGEYVLREVQALIRFHRYRSLKKMYVSYCGSILSLAISNFTLVSSAILFFPSRYDPEFAFHEQKFHKMLLDLPRALETASGAAASSTASAGDATQA